MIASDEPWVRAPVVSPGAWNRSASIRMQRCSISAVRGYSAWSMKLRCRFSAMIRCASGSIHVVTKVARLRAGSPSNARSSETSRMASRAVMPVSGNSRLGTSWVAKRLPKRIASGTWSEIAVIGFSFEFVDLPGSVVSSLLEPHASTPGTSRSLREGSRRRPTRCRRPRLDC